MIPAEAVHRHLLAHVYERPWWGWFRKTYSLRCWTCDVVVYEWTRRGPNEGEK